MADLYRQVLKPYLFSLDPEQAHHLTFFLLKWGLAIPFSKYLLGEIPGKNLEAKLAGIPFQNPVGLAAGMDKNAELVDIWPLLGFGFAEIGTITPRPQSGNPRPRLFRLPADQAIINRMGFNNAGMHAAAKRLAKRKNQDFVIGGNIGKNKDTPNEKAHEDYLACFKTLFPLVQYFTVNVSSPNTPGLRQLLEKEALSKILEPLQNENQKQENPKPLFLKISPDMEAEQIPMVVEVCKSFGLNGIVATNTTISRSGLKTDTEEVKQIGAGGLSGKPLENASALVLKQLNQLDSGLILMSSGGIMDEKEAKSRFESGASAIQIYTGLVYEGPALIHNILGELKG